MLLLLVAEGWRQNGGSGGGGDDDVVGKWPGSFGGGVSGGNKPWMTH